MTLHNRSVRGKIAPRQPAWRPAEWLPSQTAVENLSITPMSTRRTRSLVLGVRFETQYIGNRQL
jgi:hypothetical protein